MSSVKNSVQKNRRTRKSGKAKDGKSPLLAVVAENDTRLRERPVLATLRRIQMGAELDWFDRINLELLEQIAQGCDDLTAIQRKKALKALPGGAL